MVKIYSLAHPITKEIRYIGKTIKSLNARYNSHIVANDKSYRTSWIKSLLKENLKPVIELIDEVDDLNWQFWEQYWISQFKAWGFRLTNLTSGGEGMHGYNPSFSTRQKLSKASKGRKNTWAYKTSIKTSKPVIAYDKNNNFCYRFKSITEASKSLGIRNTHICSCCKGKLGSAGGYIWKYDK